MLDPDTKQAIRLAFKAGSLCVQSVDPTTKQVGISVVLDVMQHHTPHKQLARMTMDNDASVTCTVDHSLFRDFGSRLIPITPEESHVGDCIVGVHESNVVSLMVKAIDVIHPVEHTYDLSVPGPENFVLSNGILAHNSYSIGGVNLDLEKSSKYESLKQNAEGQFDKAAEAKTRTVKWIRGLQQPRFGTGIRSAFGPFTGRGVMSPRNFL